MGEEEVEEGGRGRGGSRIGGGGREGGEIIEGGWERRRRGEEGRRPRGVEALAEDNGGGAEKDGGSRG